MSKFTKSPARTTPTKFADKPDQNGKPSTDATMALTMLRCLEMELQQTASNRAIGIPQQERPYVGARSKRRSTIRAAEALPFDRKVAILLRYKIINGTGIMFLK
jgi:hypothetical protein